MRKRAPSPAIVISIIALVFAVAGTALAGMATISVLSKKEMKQTRRLAKAEIRRAAPGLSVEHAKSADIAAASNHAASADTAADANQLGGNPAGDFQRRLWAVVRADGSLARGAGVISSSGAG